MAIRTISNAGGNWNLTSTWVEGVIPTASDDVIATATSGALNVTTATCVARSVDFTNYTNTFSMIAAAVLTVGTSTGNPGNVALKMVAGMTVSFAVGSSLIFTSTYTASTLTVTTAGKALPTNVTFGISTSTANYVLSDAITSTSTTITVAKGGFDTASFSMTIGNFGFIATTTARTISLGSSNITISGQFWGQNGTAVPSGLTMSAASSTITFAASSSSFNGGGQTYGTVIFPSTASGVVISGANTFTTLTKATTNSTTDTLSLDANQTITGTLTIDGNLTALSYRLLVQSTTPGVQKTITAASFSSNGNVDFMDIAGAGAAAPFSGSGTGFGNALGNSGITFPTSRTIYARTAGNWSLGSVWSLTSGGAAASTMPLPQDDVVFDSSSGVGTYTINTARIGRNLTVSGTFAGTFATNTTWSLFGSITLNSICTFGGTNQLFLRGRSTTHTITSAGKTFGMAVATAAPGGKYTLADAFVCNGAFTIQYGDYDTAGFDQTSSTFVANVAGLRNIQLRTSTISLLGTSNIFFFNSTLLTMDASSATITVVGNTGTNRNLSYLGTLSAIGTVNLNGKGNYSFTGPMTITNLNVVSGALLYWAVGQINTVLNCKGVGVPNDYVYIANANSSVSTPNSIPLQISGDIDVRVLCSLDATGATQTLLSKLVSGGQGYEFGLQAAGNLQFIWVDGAAANQTTTSTVALPAFIGTKQWYRATMQVNNGGFRNTKFYTSPDGVIWTQLGSTVPSVSTSIATGVSPLTIGCRPDNTRPPLGCKLYRAQIRSVYDADTNLVFDADFSSKMFGEDTFVESSPNAALVTLVGGAIPGDGRIDIRSLTAGSLTTIVLPNSSTVPYTVCKDVVFRGGTYKGPGGKNNGNTQGVDFRPVQELIAA